MLSVIPNNVNNNKLRHIFDQHFKIMSEKDADTKRGGSNCSTMTRWCSIPAIELHDKFFRDSVQLILGSAVFEGTQRGTKVVDFQEPKQLATLVDLEVREDGESDDKLLSLMEAVIKYSVKPGHPFFVNQLYGGLDPYGLIGQWLTDALNPAVYTYEVAPVFTLMEEVVLKEMRRLVGYSDGDGIFSPGGSLSNAYAISCARYKAFPEIKAKGVFGVGRVVFFCSEDAHYSMLKMAEFQGIGSENAVKVKTDERYKLIPEELRKAIEKSKEEGGKPFAVMATAGTTVFGAFDPIEEIADICEEYGLWLHVDAAWGGSLLMSAKHKHLLKGIERADSVTWNPHKMLTAPQQCSVFLTRHKGLLTATHVQNASYLFQKDKIYDSKYDTGDKHIQCGRRADVGKFWFMWKAKGLKGFEEHVNKVYDTAHYFKEQISKRPGFELVLEKPECTNITFWYIPPSLRGKEAEPDYKERLNQVAPKIKGRMMEEGCCLMSYQQFKGHPNFFRLVVNNSGLEQEDMDEMIAMFERLGADL